jgi:hypothetical protein
VFLINSRQGDFRCGLFCKRQALFRSYGRFFAEFLEDPSLVRLTLLELVTCDGLRYGFLYVKLEDFLGRLFTYISQAEAKNFHSPRFLCSPDFPKLRTSTHERKSNNAHMLVFSVPPSPHKKSWNINHVSIGSGYRHYLRPD